MHCNKKCRSFFFFVWFLAINHVDHAVLDDQRSGACRDLDFGTAHGDCPDCQKQRKLICLNTFFHNFSTAPQTFISDAFINQVQDLLGITGTPTKFG